MNRFSQKGAIDIVVVLAVIVFALAGAGWIAYSNAAPPDGKGGGNKGGDSSSLIVHTTDATEQPQGIFGELVNDKGKKYWSTSSNATSSKGSEADIGQSWSSNYESSKYELNGYPAATYRHCFEIQSTEPAYLLFEATQSSSSKGSVSEITREVSFTSVDFSEYCVLHTVTTEQDRTGQNDWTYSHSIKVLNNAEIKIKQSSITQLAKGA